MDLRVFSQQNRERCESKTGFNHSLSAWSTSDWIVAVLGELGEAANVVKKLNRARDGVAGNDTDVTQLREELKCELADTFIYLDLLVQHVGFQLSEIVPGVYNRKSEKIGYKTKMVENPINVERVIRIESQLLMWLAGQPLHNGQSSGRGECTPDFACCDPDLLEEPDKRIAYVLSRLRDCVVGTMRSEEPSYGEEIDLPTQEILVRGVSRWFDDLILDTCPETRNG